MLLFDLTIVFVDNALQQVKDQRLIKVWPTAGVEDGHLYLNVAVKRRKVRQVRFALLFKRFGVIQSLLTLDEGGFRSQHHKTP
jgi:hypothetical protein